MKCPLCGHTFNEDQARGGCSACNLFSACKMLRCPNCGYEPPPEPAFIKKLKEWRKRDAKKS